MNLALLSLDGFMMIVRWLHVFFGIVWIGHLYYINFVQGAFVNELDAGGKVIAQTKLFPKVLWWFRWGAFWTAALGLLYLGILGHTQGASYFHSSYGVSILSGALMGLFMAYNVWFIIWPHQKVIMASAEQVAKGGQPIAGVADRGAKATLASRHNVLFSIPMLFFMLSSRHLPFEVGYEASLTPYWIFLIIVAGGLEFNAMKGKLGPMKTVRGVITSGFVLTAVMYLGMEFLTKS